MTNLDGWIYRYAFYGALLISFIILFTPGSDRRLPIPHLDKVIHGVTFLLLAITAHWRFRRWRMVALGLFVYAVASEVIQHFWIPGREFDLLDIGADAAGMGFGLLIRGEEKQV